jgi:hypothetical protein
MELNERQPPTQQNYTTLGFAHVRAPDGAIEVLSKFFDAHRSTLEQAESWPPGNSYTNHWAENPTFMVSLEANAEGRRVKGQVRTFSAPASEHSTPISLLYPPCSILSTFP